MKKKTGNLLTMFDEGKFDVIIHGCNCFHMMGAGIAGQISLKYPEALQADKKSQKGNIDKLSNCTIARIDRGDFNTGFIVNLYTQYNGGKDLYEEALLLGLKKLACKIPSNLKIGIPAIGCGIAGGDWDELSPKIAEIMKKYDITYVEYSTSK